MNKYLVIDFETTGNKPKDGDRIIQIGAVLIENGSIVERYSTLVNPGCSISPFIENLTGITNSMVKTAPDIEDVLPDLLKFTEGATLVGHNVYFDLSFLQNALVESGYLPFSGFVLDTVEMARLLLPSQDGYRLRDLSIGLDIPLERPHRADEDAGATAEIFLQLVQKLEGLPLITIQRLLDLSRSFQSDLYQLLKVLERKKLLSASQEESSNSVYRQLCLFKEKEAEGFDEQPLPGDFSAFVTSLSGEDGLLAASLPGFEMRPSQLTMIQQVYTSFKEGKHLIVEAGTGTGKSLAYLIPSAFWAKESGEKIVISTHTIQLQEQLYQRDLPLLNSIFSGNLKEPALLKGRNHYLCLRKYENSLDEASENYDFQLSKGQILVWLTETKTGDIEEINLPSGGQFYWKQVQSDAASCLNRHCPWFSRCYYHQARRKAQNAEIIITNHSLLFTDIQAEHRILPSYGYAVVDEAHHFDDVASRHLGETLSSFQVENTFQFLLAERGGGILEELEQILRKEMPQTLPRIEEILSSLPLDLRQCRDSWREMFQILNRWIGLKGREGEEIGHTLYRYKKSDLQTSMGKGLIAAAQNSLEWMAPLGKKLESLTREIQEQGDSMSLSLRGAITDLNGLTQDLLEYMELLHGMLLSVDEDNVYWIELDRRGFRKGIYMNRAPLDVSVLIRNLFFEKKDSVVLTSATMSVNDSFQYTIDRMGIQDLYLENEVDTSLLPSPFNFPEQALLCVPAEIPGIKDSTEEQFVVALSRSLSHVARTTEGRMLVLFTSYSMLRNAYSILKENLSVDGFTVLGHGIDSHSRSKLTRQFRSSQKSILLGTSSFWEGVDIPGDDLSCLAIVRLPFVPPNHPLLEARTQKMKEERKNPFMHLSVPQAVIRFKQGFGRLVRTMSDRGVVLVYDRRILDTQYGKIFINSLPKTPILYKATGEMLKEIGDWTRPID